MNAKIINPFFTATQKVFDRMLDLTIQKGKITLVEDMVPGKDANIIIGMTGDIYGSVLFSFPKDMTLEMVKIMSGMELEEIDVFVSSAIGEIANIISGNVVTYFAKDNYKCDIVPPQIVLGVNKSVSMATDKAISVSLKTEIGEFDICVSLKEK
jgi:chemotaxis protein CheX